MATIFKIAQKLSKKANPDGKYEVLVRLNISRTQRPTVKTGICVSDSVFNVKSESEGYKFGEIRVPRSNIKDYLVVQEALEANKQMKKFISTLTAICSVSPAEAIDRDYLTDALNAIEEYHITKIDTDSLSSAIEEYRRVKKGLVKGRFNTFEEMFLHYLNIEKGNYSRDFRKGHLVLLRDILRWQEYVRATSDPAFTFDVRTATTDDICAFFEYLEAEYDLSIEDPELFERLLTVVPKFVSTRRHTPRLERRGANTIVKLRKKFATFCKWCHNEGFIKENIFENIKIGCESFGKPFILNKPIEELRNIYNAELSTKTLNIQRDIFVFQCLIGCRVGDLLRLRKSNVNDGFIEYAPHKTQGVVCRIALPAIAQEIIDRYSDNEGESLLPFISSQKYNQALKQIFTECGLTYMKIVRDAKTGEDIQAPINKVISSHLARRMAEYLWRKASDNPNLPYWVLGHSAPTEAHSRYVAENTEEMLDAAERLNTMLSDNCTDNVPYNDKKSLQGLTKAQLIERQTQLIELLRKNNINF